MSKCFWVTLEHGAAWLWEEEPKRVQGVWCDGKIACDMTVPSFVAMFGFMPPQDRCVKVTMEVSHE